LPNPKIAGSAMSEKNKLNNKNNIQVYSIACCQLPNKDLNVQEQTEGKQSRKHHQFSSRGPENFGPSVDGPGLLPSPVI
jgi:hypothetical protein